MKLDTSTVFHIHEILIALQQSPEPRTVEEIKAFIIAKFGPTSLFFSCTLQDMNIEQAVDFMLSRQKINEISPGKFSTSGADSCDH